MKYITKDSGKRVEFESGMHRDTDTDKVRYDLIDMPMFKRWAELMTRGAQKYGANNWQLANSKQEMDRFKSSAFRHFIQWFESNEDEDHGAAVFFNIAAAERLKDMLNDKHQKQNGKRTTKT